MLFRWNQWNVDHIAEHGVSPEEAEWVVEHARRPYPELREDEQMAGGRPRPRRTMVAGDFRPRSRDEDTAYVIHARPLTDREKKRERRRIR